jgi:6-phosphogluconolactonase (cycloisomerase 2 family)
LRPPRRLSLALFAALASLALTAQASHAGTLYTNNYGDKQLAALTIGQDGLLSPIAGSPFPLPHYFDGLAITPDGRLMVTAFGFEDMIGTQALSNDGTPSTTTPAIPAPVQGSSPPAISPDGRFAYVAAEPSGVAAFAIGADGSLSRIGGSFGEGGGIPALTTDGRFLFTPNFDGKSIERFAVQADGSLSPLGTNPLGIEGPFLIRVTPDGRYAILLSEAIGSDDIRSFAIGSDGSLTPTGSALKTTGNVSGLAIVSPDGRFFYNANGNEDSITAYAIDANGLLSQAGTPAPAGIDDPDGLAMSVDGRFLYVERFQGQTIQAFAVGADGALTQIGGPAPTGGESDGVAPVTRPSAPIAAFAAAPGAPRSKTTFDARGSADATATIVSYNWDFGDGTTLSSSAPTASHRYSDAGVYTVRLRLTDSNGCSGFSYTGQTAYCGGKDATVSVDTPPAIYGIAVTPTKLATASLATRKKRPRRPVVHYKLSESARVTFTVSRKLAGRKVGKTCKRKTARNARKPKCRLQRRVGTFNAHGKAGKNKRLLPRRFKGRALKPGGYVLTAVAQDAAKGKSAPRSATFKVTKPRVRKP